MKKSTKGAVAASAAALLLLGSLGTHATWSDDGTIDGTSLASGHLKLLPPDCGQGWLIDGVVFNPATIKLAPGSVVVEVCTFTVDTGGAKLQAKLVAGTPTYASATGLSAALTTTATYKDEAGDPVTNDTVFEDGDKITARIEVTLPTSVDGAVQDLSATLEDVTVTATQA